MTFSIWTLRLLVRVWFFLFSTFSCAFQLMWCIKITIGYDGKTINICDFGLKFMINWCNVMYFLDVVVMLLLLFSFFSLVFLCYSFMLENSSDYWDCGFHHSKQMKLLLLGELNSTICWSLVNSIERYIVNCELWNEWMNLTRSEKCSAMK